MSETVVLIGSLAAAKDAHHRAKPRPFIGLMRPIDDDEVSWGYQDIALPDLKTAENAYDPATGRWRLRCMFHDDDWHEARHSTITSFLDELAKDGGAGVVFGYGEYVPCFVWHLRDRRARCAEVEPEQFPPNVRELLAAEEWHAAANAILDWCDKRA